MIKVDFDVTYNTMQFGCNICGRCNSVFARSLCEIKDRGCCWYFPKFTLVEIHKMVKTEEGMMVLKKIINLKSTEIHNYYIHSKGYFNKEKYIDYIKGPKELWDHEEDKTIYFRVCPFVERGKGCIIPAQYRSYVCNIFICNEVIKKVYTNHEFHKYIVERDNYVKWIEWEDNEIQRMLMNKHIDLKNNFDEVIKTLKELPIEEYGFDELKPMIAEDEIINE